MPTSSNLSEYPSAGDVSESAPRAERDLLRERVDELERSRATLIERLQLLEMIFGGDTIVAYDWDVASGAIVFDTGIQRLLGRDPTEIVPRFEWWRGQWHPEDRARVSEAFEGLDDRLPLVDVEYRVRSKNGWLWVRDRSRMAPPDERGRIARIRGALRDITSRKEAERALRESEKKYRGVIENIQDVFYRSDEHGRLLMGSPSGARIFGYESVDEMIGLPLESFWVDTSRRDRLLAEVRAKGSVHDYEGVLKKKDGTTFYASLSTHYYYDDDGRRLGTQGIIRDISERKRAEEERIELERRLLHAQKLESLGVLAGGIAHDFNNMLMMILGSLDLALAKLPEAIPARAQIERAVKASHAAADLARQMLAYAGRGDFVVSRLDLNRLVEENATLFRSALGKSVSLWLRLAPGGCEIEGDACQVQQVVMNLLTNASEAIGERSGTITLSTGVEDYDEGALARSRLHEIPPPGRFAFVEIADDGCGMDESTTLRIFDPFFTTKFAGRGFGLSAVLGIVRGHKGAILLESAAGTGTRFRILFPACTEQARRPDAAAHVSSNVADAAVKTGKILVVEDERHVRETCAAYIEHLGCQVLCATDGDEALEILGKHGRDISCVLLDLTLPRSDGMSALREIKRLWPDARVILCSGHEEREAARRFAGEGLAGFLQKPYRFHELRTNVERVLKQSC